MFKKLLGAALCLALLIPSTACSALGTAGAVVSAATSTTPLGDAYTFDERGMAAVTLAYNTTARLYQTARQRGICRASCRDQWRPLLLQLRDLRLAARAAYRLGQADSWRDRVASFKVLADRITARFATATN